MKELSIDLFPNKLIVIENNRSYLLPFDEIIAIESDKPYVVIFTKQYKHVVRCTLTTLERKLPEFFCRCNRSVIVNLTAVSCIDKNNLVAGELCYPISRRQKPIINKFLLKLRVV